MSLLQSAHMDLGLLVFIAIVCLKYALKDKDYKGFKWIVIGGLSLLLQNVIFFVNLGTTYAGLFRDISAIITAVIMLIGSIWLIKEFFE